MKMVQNEMQCGTWNNYLNKCLDLGGKMLKIQRRKVGGCGQTKGDIGELMSYCL